MSVLEVGFSAARAHRIVAIDRCPVLAPEPGRRDRCGVGDCGSARSRPTSRSTFTVTATRRRPRRRCARLRAAARRTLMAALARVAAKRDLARLTRHGELIAQLRPPTLRIGKAIVPSAAGRVPAGDRRRRGGAGAARPRRLRRRRQTSPTCLPASARSRCGSPSARACSPSTTTKPRSPRSSAPPRRLPASSRSTTETRDLFRRPLAAGRTEAASTPSSSIRRARAPRRRRANSPRARVPLIVAVSCNPATFARDASELVRGGYRLDDGHAGRSVPLRGARRDRRALCKISRSSPTKRVNIRAPGTASEQEKWMSGLGGLNKAPDGVVIGLVQLQLPTMASTSDLAAQTKKICAMVRKARKGMTTMDLVVFPEYSLHGLSMDTNAALMCGSTGRRSQPSGGVRREPHLGLLLDHGAQSRRQSLQQRHHHRRSGRDAALLPQDASVGAGRAVGAGRPRHPGVRRSERQQARADHLPRRHVPRDGARMRLQGRRDHAAHGRLHRADPRTPGRSPTRRTRSAT